MALDRATGELMWETHLNGDGLVQLLVDGNYLYATTHGELFCLEALTGRIRWGNPLQGFPAGAVSIAVEGKSPPPTLYVAEAKPERHGKGATSDTIFID